MQWEVLVEQWEPKASAARVLRKVAMKAPDSGMTRESVVNFHKGRLVNQNVQPDNEEL